MIDQVDSVAAVWNALERREYDLIIMDIALPGDEGMEVLNGLQRLPDAPPVLVLSSWTGPSTVVKAIKGGADQFLAKPYNPEELRSVVQDCIIRSKIAQYSDSAPPDDMSALVGDSPGMRKLKETIRLYAASNMPVLILGESGSGKELAARTLHQVSSRRQEPYRVVHCGAIPHSLIESELYGSETGAFTGAVNRAGYFEQAHRGSLFLDEIGELPLEGQVKLLRILEDCEIVRVGGRKKIKIDTRIISATNRDLGTRVKEGKFREDLLFRLNTLSLKLPPLRKHPEDIPRLCSYFLKSQSKAANKRNDGEAKISRAALVKLMEHHWPGNIRELKNTVLRASVLARGGKIEAEHIRIETI